MRFTASTAISVAVLCAIPSARGSAEEALTITASASVTTASGATATAPVTVIVRRFATDAERDELMAALKQGGTASARALLAARGDVGTVQLGSHKTPIKYAYARTLGDGRLMTVVTAEPIVFLGAGLPGAKPTTGFDLGLVLLEVTAGRPGRGELAPATTVRLTEEGAIVTEGYNADLVQLTNVVRK